MPSVPMERHLRIWHAIERYATDPGYGIVSINELCRQTGASARMLYNVCRTFTGLSVTAYIRQQRRLKRALEMLRRAQPNETTVTEAAIFCGFDHLGRFAERFRGHHGQVPSRILRKSLAASVVAPPPCQC
jgi:AraC-like DNA-binding protein